MSCSRCGQQRRIVHGAPAPSIARSPMASGGVVIPARPGSAPLGSGVPSNIIRQSITGLKYVPGK